MVSWQAVIGLGAAGGWLCGGMLLAGAFLVLIEAVRGRSNRNEEDTQGEDGTMARPADPLCVGASVQITPQSEAKGSSSTRLGAQIVSTEGRSLTLRLPSGIVAAGTRHTVSLTHADALYRFTIAVSTVQPDLSHTGHLLAVCQRVGRMERVQRRAFERVAVNAPVVLAPGIEATLRNLSSGGFCADLSCRGSAGEAARMLAGLPEGAEISATLLLPELNQTFAARVCTSQKVVVRAGVGARIACEFVAMPVEQWQPLTQAVTQARQRDRTRIETAA